MYRDLDPKAYAEGFAYGQKYGLRPGPDATPYAEGYTGAVIASSEDETPKQISYSAYCEGYCDGVVARSAR
jgi:hypothetical protein